MYHTYCKSCPYWYDEIGECFIDDVPKGEDFQIPPCDEEEAN